LKTTRAGSGANNPLHLKSIKVLFLGFKHNQHRTLYGWQEEYEEQKLTRVKGAKKKIVSGQQKGLIFGL